MHPSRLLIVFFALATACASTQTTEPEAQLAQPSSTVPTVVEPISPTPSTTEPAPSTAPPSTTAPTTTASTVPPKTRLVISGTGDVNLDPAYIPALGREDSGYAWDGLQDMFLTDDLTIVNLECAASDLGSLLPKTFAFRCDTQALPAMAAAGIEVANLGNNHSGDAGKEALVDSRGRLEAVGVAPVGAGKDATEAHQPALLDINGWRVAVLGFGGIFPGPEWAAAEDRAGMADGDTIETMVAAVAAADELADLVIVSIHWGVELDTTPRQDDRERAEAMIAAGADAIFGHHAHRLQPLELVDGIPVAWGLGNFVWPNLSASGSTTAVAQVIFEPDGSIEACLIPAFIESPGQPVLQIEHDPDDPCAAVTG